MDKVSITVLGAGSWGTALAILLAADAEPTLLWDHDPHHIENLHKLRENSKYLPGVTLPEAVRLDADLAKAIEAAQDILIAVPSHAFRSILESARHYISKKHRIIWATKGFESGSGKLMHQVVNDVLGSSNATAIISGPTFATEVAIGLPTAVTIASKDATFASEMAERFHTNTFRAYTSTDVTGVEVGGAVKNVLAIAAGIADGLKFGANTRSALITRGLVEMRRLGVALGGQQETFMGLAGLGDLALTCTDNQSRNRRCGLSIGSGKTLDQALNEIGQVVEGVQTAREVFQLSARMGVNMPITNQVYKVLYEGVSPDTAVQALLARDQKAEVP
jgi:glycerol-3-phosphate dehydrogenase (NAD(P)+)